MEFQEHDFQALFGQIVEVESLQIEFCKHIEDGEYERNEFRVRIKMLHSEKQCYLHVVSLVQTETAKLGAEMKAEESYLYYLSGTNPEKLFAKMFFALVEQGRKGKRRADETSKSASKTNNSESQFLLDRLKSKTIAVFTTSSFTVDAVPDISNSSVDHQNDIEVGYYRSLSSRDT